MLLVQILLNSSVIAVQVLLLAAALYIVYTVSGVFAVHLGALMIVSAYTYYALVIQWGVSVILGWLGAITLAVLLSLLFYLILRPLIKRDLDLLALLASIGLMLGLEAVMGMIFGGGPKFLTEDILKTLSWGEYRITAVGLVILGLGVFTTLCSAFTIYATPAGRKLRAVYQHQAAAQSLQLKVDRIQAITFALTGGLVALIGVLSGLNEAITPEAGTHYLLPALVVFVVGGMKSFKGTVLTALIVVLSTQVLTSLSFGGVNIASTWINALIFLFALVVLLLRPDGLISLNTRQN